MVRQKMGQDKVEGIGDAVPQPKLHPSLEFNSSMLIQTKH